MCHMFLMWCLRSRFFFFFFFNDTATTEIYTLSLHDALPISPPKRRISRPELADRGTARPGGELVHLRHRSEEHTSELQSQSNLVCRLLLEKKKYLRILVIALGRILSTLITPLIIAVKDCPRV